MNRTYLQVVVLAIGFWTTPLALSAADTGSIELLGADRIDFGRYSAHETKVARFQIRNKGSGLLKINALRKNCGCASVTSSKMTLRPREEAVIEVVILPESISGLYSKNVFVENNDPTQRLLRLTVTGTAIPLVAIQPQPNIYARRLPLNQPWQQTFELNPASTNVIIGQPVVESNVPLQVSLQARTNHSAVVYQLDVMLNPTNGGQWKCKIEMPILYPTNAKPAAITISGNIGAEITAIPKIIYLPLSGGPVQRDLRLRLLDATATGTIDPETLLLPRLAGVSFIRPTQSDKSDLVISTTFSNDFLKRLASQGQIIFPVGLEDVGTIQIICKPSRR